MDVLTEQFGIAEPGKIQKQHEQRFYKPGNDPTNENSIQTEGRRREKTGTKAHRRTEYGGNEQQAHSGDSPEKRMKQIVDEIQQEKR